MTKVDPMEANASPTALPSKGHETLLGSSPSIGSRLAPLFSENILAKTYRTAAELTGVTDATIAMLLSENDTVGHAPSEYPEYVPQHGADAGRYMLRDPQFWTCGFFPGMMYSLIERLWKYPQSVRLEDVKLKKTLREVMPVLGWLCAKPLLGMAHRVDTHDVGFMVMPALQKNWELTGNLECLAAIRLAARNLATRFLPAARGIRSWDQRVQKNITITSQNEDFILIIDSMCNLDLMFYAASHFPEDSYLYEIATLHATTLLRTHLRPESASNGSKVKSAHGYTGQWYSTFHVVNVDPRNGEIKKQFTAQGYADGSTWARGQAWAILGYAQTYQWTRDQAFLDAACGLSEYFLYRLAIAPSCVESRPSNNSSGRHVPLWDFDAPIEDEAEPLRDSSAGAIAANGLLVLYQNLTGLGQHVLASRFFDAAVDIAEDLVHFSLAAEQARFTSMSSGKIIVEDKIPGQKFEGVLKNGTANNNQHAMKRYANHGLVYGDYYLMEFGNQLLRMGMV